MLNSNRADTFNISSRLMTHNSETGVLSPEQLSAPLSTQRGKNKKISIFKTIMMGKRDISKFESLPKYLQILVNDSTENFANQVQVRLGVVKGIDINTSFIFSPDSRYLVLWNVIFMLILIENLFYLPYKMSVDIIGTEEQRNTGYIFYVMLPFVSYLFDIVLTCNTAFYQKGKIYEDRYTILTNYIKRYFFLDLFLTIAQILSISVYPVFDAFVTLRFVKLNEIIQRLQMRLGLDEKYQIFIVVKLVLNLIYVVHYCACAFLFIGVQEQKANQVQWIDKFNFSTLSPLELYVTALYWSSITLLTVGYGDITPQTSVERIFCIFVTMVTIGIVGYVINSISQILKNMNDKVEKRNTKMAKIEVFLQRNNIHKDLSMRIKNYYEHWFSSQFQEDTDDKRLTKHLALPLRRELYTQIYHKELEKSFYIKNYVSPACISELCQYVKLARYLPGEQIFTKNQLITSLMILKTGTVTICSFTSGVNVQSKIDTSLKLQSEVLVEEKFLFQEKSTFDSKAKGLCVIQYLEYDDFMTVLRSFPDDYEQFMYFRARFESKSQFQKLRICELCTENHSFENCYQIFLDKNNEKILMKHIKQETQLRTSKYVRSLAKKQFRRMEIQVGVLKRLLDDQDFDPNLLNDKYLQKLGLHEKELKCEENSEIANTEIFVPQSQGKLEVQGQSQKIILFTDSDHNNPLTADKDSTDQTAKAPLKRKFGRFRDLVKNKQLTLRMSTLPLKRLKVQLLDLDLEIPASIKENLSIKDLNQRKSPKQREKKKSETDEESLLNQSIQSDHKSPINRRATQSIEQKEKGKSKMDDEGQKQKLLIMHQGDHHVSGQHYESIPDFEMMRDYKIFYPKFNLKRVITKVNKNIVGVVNQSQKEELLKKYHNRVNSNKVKTALSVKIQED